MLRVLLSAIALILFIDVATAEETNQAKIKVRNMVPPLDDRDDPQAHFRREPGSLPIVVEPFYEHRRGQVPHEAQQQPLKKVEIVAGLVTGTNSAGKRFQLTAENNWVELDDSQQQKKDKFAALKGFRSSVQNENRFWIATDQGFFYRAANDHKLKRHMSYGTNGPLATDIRDLAVDSQGRLWVATPLGLNRLDPDGQWHAIRGRDGLPYEDLTAIAVDQDDQLWIGTTRGLIHYRPQVEGRQWFYRAGQRYLPNDRVNDVAISDDGLTIYTATDSGLGRLDLAKTTLLEKGRNHRASIEPTSPSLGPRGSCDAGGCPRS